MTSATWSGGVQIWSQSMQLYVCGRSACRSTNVHARTLFITTARQAGKPMARQVESASHVLCDLQAFRQRCMMQCNLHTYLGP